MTKYFLKIDQEGFYNGEINASFVNEHNQNSILEAPLPEEPLTGLEQWRWVNGNWIKQNNYKNTTWYNPNVLNQLHIGKTFDDEPPPGWKYWEPGKIPEYSKEAQDLEMWTNIRIKRDKLLLESDWTQLPDVRIPNKEAWADYRQKLRDITNQPDPEKVIWPTKPIL